MEAVLYFVLVPNQCRNDNHLGTAVRKSFKSVSSQGLTYHPFDLCNGRFQPNNTKLFDFRFMPALFML